MAMPATPDDIPVTHNEAENRFEAMVYGELAVCDYRIEGDRMIFTHTYVPPELRGRKVAQKLVTVALDYAKEKSLRIVPACSYVDAFVARRSEYQALLA